MRVVPYNEFLKRYPQSCPDGFTRSDLDKYFGAKEGEQHPLWKQLSGQTGSICEGRAYSHEKKAYYPTVCHESPHGFISYTHDVYEWWAGLPVSDW